MHSLNQIKLEHQEIQSRDPAPREDKRIDINPAQAEPAQLAIISSSALRSQKFQYYSFKEIIRYHQFLMRYLYSLVILNSTTIKIKKL